jgi:hypothetical protein
MSFVSVVPEFVGDAAGEVGEHRLGVECVYDPVRNGSD